MSGIDEKVSDSGTVEKSGSNYPITTSKVTHRPWWKLSGKDTSFAPVDPDSVTTSNPASTQDIEITGLENIHGSVFDDSGAAQFYQPIEKYEGAHRFDPNATWTPAEEKALVKTVSPAAFTNPSITQICDSSIGESACQRVPSSSPCSWIEGTFHRLCLTIC